MSCIEGANRRLARDASEGSLRSNGASGSKGKPSSAFRNGFWLISAVFNLSKILNLVGVAPWDYFEVCALVYCLHRCYIPLHGFSSGRLSPFIYFIYRRSCVTNVVCWYRVFAPVTSKF